MKRVPSTQRNARIRRQRDPRALPRLTLLLFSGLVLAGGFVFAAKQHFAAVQYGYDSEALRSQREQLIREQQQLMLQKEQASAPRRLESAARALGLKPIRANQVGTTGLKRSTAPQNGKAQSKPKASASNRRS
jgi:cell division protein FtsL